MEMFRSEVSRRIWDSKYRYRQGERIVDATIQDTWRRVAVALAGPEGNERQAWAERFQGILEDFRFLPGGRILAGAGTRHEVTLFNCFVMGLIDDSLDGIFEALKEGALTMQQGGGVGYDFSTLRPAGAPAKRVGAVASGPVSFMKIWDAMCATILSTGARRGAMMATLRCDHPDILAFVEAKREPGVLRHFNLSVQVSDDFMAAVANDADWPLVFPLEGESADREVVFRRWPGREEARPCQVMDHIPARKLWRRIARAAYDCAEPGVIFIDTVNRANNLAYCEHISATNPCGEIPLPPYGACDLGSVNLARFVMAPFSAQAALDWEGVKETVKTAVRMLDNAYEVSAFPLPRQGEAARASRRLGLGITGLADALAMLNLPYGGDEAIRWAGRAMETICHSAYRSAIELAKEKGAFPAFEAAPYLASPFVQRLPSDIREGIARHGIRNSHLAAIAPTGTISLLADNVSSGLEPIFRFRYQRHIRDSDGSLDTVEVTDYACRLFRELHGEATPLPASFVTVADVAPGAQLAMQAALQAHVDNAISKTIQISAACNFEDFVGVYEQAYRLGLKGCTAFRPNPVTGEVLSPVPPAEGRQCCSLDREAD